MLLNIIILAVLGVVVLLALLGLVALLLIKLRPVEIQGKRISTFEDLMSYLNCLLNPSPFAEISRAGIAERDKSLQEPLSAAVNEIFSPKKFKQLVERGVIKTTDQMQQLVKSLRSDPNLASLPARSLYKLFRTDFPIGYCPLSLLIKQGVIKNYNGLKEIIKFAIPLSYFATEIIEKTALGNPEFLRLILLDKKLVKTQEDFDALFSSDQGHRTLLPSPNYLRYGHSKEDLLRKVLFHVIQDLDELEKICAIIPNIFIILSSDGYYHSHIMKSKEGKKILKEMIVEKKITTVEELTHFISIFIGKSDRPERYMQILLDLWSREDEDQRGEDEDIFCVLINNGVIKNFDDLLQFFQNYLDNFDNPDEYLLKNLLQAIEKRYFSLLVDKGIVSSVEQIEKLATLSFSESDAESKGGG